MFTHVFDAFITKLNKISIKCIIALKPIFQKFEQIFYRNSFMTAVYEKNSFHKNHIHSDLDVFCHEIIFGLTMKNVKINLNYNRQSMNKITTFKNKVKHSHFLRNRPESA